MLGELGRTCWIALGTECGVGLSQMLLVVLADNLNIFWSLFPASTYHKHPGMTRWILLIDPRVDNWRNILFKKPWIKLGFEYFALRTVLVLLDG